MNVANPWWCGAGLALMLATGTADAQREGETWSVPYYSRQQIVNGDAALSALFGSGDQSSRGLIQNTWIGGTGTSQNPYPRIRYVLGRLGFDAPANVVSYTSYPHAYKQRDHHNHFHVDLRPPTRRSIDLPAGNLVATNANVASESGDDFVSSINTLMMTLNSEFGEPTSQRRYEMFVPDFPVLAANAAQTVIIADATAKTPRTDRILGVCSVIGNGISHDPNSAEFAISPTAAARSYFRYYEKRLELTDARVQTKVISITEPMHGRLEESTGGINDPSYFYRPTSGYFGDDSISAVVEIGGYRVKVIFSLKLIDAPNGGEEGTHKDLCGRLKWIP